MKLETTRVCFAECLGTMILVFCGAGAIVVNDISGGAITHVGVSLTFGLVVMALIYAVGDVSGAHLNPAVTLGFWLDGRFRGELCLPYLVSQLTGALLGAGLLRMLFWNHLTLGGTHPGLMWWQAFGMEVALTAILMFVVLRVADSAREKGIMAGAAIGGVIAFEALFGGPVSGASMNPARSLGPAFVSGAVSDLWIYVIAPCAGSALGVLASRVVQADTAGAPDSLAQNGER